MAGLPGIPMAGGLVSGQLAARTSVVVQPKKENPMCEKKKGCQKPEALEGKPEDCSPEQIKKCHGDVREHPCVETEKDK